MRLSFNKPPAFRELVRKPVRSYTFAAGLDLAQDWQPLQDFTGSTVINNELQRYPAAFDPATTRFTPTSLELTATAPGWIDAPTHVAAAPSGGRATVTLDSAAGVQVGMMVAIRYATYSYYWVTGINGNDVTFNVPIACPAGALFIFLPLFSVTPSASVDGARLIPAAAVPAGVTPGMTMHNFYGGMTQEITVTAVDAKGITVSAPVWVGPQSVIAFGSAVRAGQIWSRFAVQPPGPGETVAIELDAQIPPTSRMGSWPAFWLYSKDDGNRNDASEIDIFEFFNSDTSGNAYTGYNHGGGVGASRYRRPGAWDSFENYRDPLTDYGAISRRWGLIWTDSSVAKWIDGELVKEDAYRWTSPCAAQIGINLSAGSLTPNFLSNGMVPRNAAQFPYKFSLRSLNVWRY